MNILASYNWIKKYVKTDLTPAEFARRTTAAGNSVERVDDLRERFEKIVVGIVKEIKPHPNANKLRLAEVDIGASPPARVTAVGGIPSKGGRGAATAVGGVPSGGGRGGGSVEVVCGGTNLAEGQRVALALPGSRVRWHGEHEWVELKPAEIRGVKSHGMVCSPVELGFDKLQGEEREIWDITQFTNAKPGTPLADALDLNDVIFEIEVTTNRPDCMSIVGQAREAGAVTGAALRWKPAKAPAALRTSGPANLRVTVKDSDLCLKYDAVLIEGVKVGPSPWWLQKELLLAGHRPINNVVDVTNYVLHELGQPLHAFDADKLDPSTSSGQGAPQIIVRRAKSGETIQALDGKTYKLLDKMLVIADAARPVAIAGVMGGEETGTSGETKRIVIESATFNPVSVRRTSRALNLLSDSSMMFEKGLSTEATGPALARAVELILEVAGGRVASAVASKQAKAYKPLSFSFDPAEAQTLIGADISEKEMIAMLKRLGFKLTVTPSSSPLKRGRSAFPPARGGTKGGGSHMYNVEVPYWRDHDIENSRDFVEEVARLYGYANIPSMLPPLTAAPEPQDPLLTWERRAKEALRGAGITESYNYSFVSAPQLSRYGISPEETVKLANPLSSDQEYMRPSLVPTMLTTIEANQKRQASGALFELAPVYLAKKQDLPEQKLHLLIAVYGPDGYAAFRQAKGFLERLLREMGIHSFRLETGLNGDRWHPSRSALVWIGEHEPVGMVGQVGASVANAFGVDTAVVLVELNFEELARHATTRQTYHPIPLYPEVKRDLAVVVDERAVYAKLEHELRATSHLLRTVELFDIYRGKGVPEGQKSLATHLVFRADDRTLSAEEVEKEMEKLRDVLKKDFHGIVRS